jgi:hypothetical protein
MHVQTETSVDHGRIGHLAARLIPVWNNRPDTEHEQAIIRFVVGTITALCILMVVFRDGVPSSPDQTLLVIIGLFFSAALGIISG